MFIKQVENIPRCSGNSFWTWTCIYKQMAVRSLRTIDPWRSLVHSWAGSMELTDLIGLKVVRCSEFLNILSDGIVPLPHLSMLGLIIPGDFDSAHTALLSHRRIFSCLLLHLSVIHSLSLESIWHSQKKVFFPKFSNWKWSFGLIEIIENYNIESCGFCFGLVMWEKVSLLPS